MIRIEPIRKMIVSRRIFRTAYDATGDRAEPAARSLPPNASLLHVQGLVPAPREDRAPTSSTSAVIIMRTITLVAASSSPAPPPPAPAAAGLERRHLMCARVHSLAATFVQKLFSKVAR